MNYKYQSKLIKPNAKCCSWCKNIDNCYTTYKNNLFELTHRQWLKVFREGGIRYCKKYRYSKEEFAKWKKFRKAHISR